MLKLTSVRAKANANYTCRECGSTELIQSHHQIPGDDDSIIVLCAECHSRRHPDVPRALFFNKGVQPYWHNKSASSLAKSFGVHSRTIIRAAKRLGILPGELTAQDEESIKNSLRKSHRKIKPVVIRYPMRCRICGNNWLAKSLEPKKCPACNKSVKEKPKKVIKEFVLCLRNYFCPRCVINWLSLDVLYKCPMGHNINAEKNS